MPAILNAGNEIAVAAFLDEQIRFTAIPDVISHCMDAVEPNRAESIEEVLMSDRLAREAAQRYIATLN